MRTPSPTPIRAVAALAADGTTAAASGMIASRNLGDTIRQSRRTALIARARWAGALGAALITLLLAPNASAMAPDRFSFTDGGTDPGFQHCDGFDISLTSVGIVDGAVFFGDTGDPVRFQLHWHGRDTFTNSVSGKVVINPFQFTETYDRVPGTDDFTVTLVGHRFQATTPGSGVVLQDVGRLVWSPGEEELLFSAGQHDLLDDFTVTLVGHRFQATTPGSGVVLQDVGRLVWSPGEEQLLFSAGQHDLLDDSQAAPFCAALS